MVTACKLANKNTVGKVRRIKPITNTCPTCRQFNEVHISQQNFKGAGFILYLYVLDIIELVIQGHILQVALISSLAEARGGRSTAAHVRLGLTTAVTNIKHLPTPLDQVTGVTERVEQGPRPVPHVLLVELQPPMPGVFILQQWPLHQSSS